MGFVDEGLSNRESESEGRSYDIFLEQSRQELWCGSQERVDKRFRDKGCSPFLGLVGQTVECTTRQ